MQTQPTKRFDTTKPEWTPEQVHAWLYAALGGGLAYEWLDTTLDKIVCLCVGKGKQAELINSQGIDAQLRAILNCDKFESFSAALNVALVHLKGHMGFDLTVQAFVDWCQHQKPVASFSQQSQRELQKLAECFRPDHDDGSAFFFAPVEAYWDQQTIDPAKLGAFSNPVEAAEWLDSEIAMLKADGHDSYAECYQDMLRVGVKEPVIASRISTEHRLWDGYHRTAVALIRGESLPAIIGMRLGA